MEGKRKLERKMRNLRSLLGQRHLKRNLDPDWLYRSQEEATLTILGQKTGSVDGGISIQVVGPFLHQVEGWISQN